jgi:asparagine synthase (glutamine-hydrolysing)
MCGIVGLANWGDIDTLTHMTNLQKHRGPDDGGTWCNQFVGEGFWGLGNRRLAIRDLSHAGHMPMSTPDGRVTITYNGEIYNDIELRNELSAKGYSFRSGSDTETILNVYLEYGEDFFKRLKGMFALAIVDIRENTPRLILARDHFGVKPLYYIYRNRKLAFASEVKSLCCLPEFSRTIHPFALKQYLTLLWVPDPLTLFDGVLKLPAGHYAIYKNGQLEIKQYWDLNYPNKTAYATSNVHEAALAKELRERFMAVVRQQMLSDVPIGAFLSAGLDSSSIVAGMAAASSHPVRTYTITFPERYKRGELTFDDANVARNTATHFGCKHSEILVEPDVVNLLPKLIWHMDEPVADPAIITAYLISYEARKEVKVLMSGVGGDELFAGYRKHQAHFYAKQYRLIPRIFRERIIEPSLLRMPLFRGTPLKGMIRLAKKMARSGSLPDHERFIKDSVYLDNDQIIRLMKEETIKTSSLDPLQQHRDYFERVQHADFLNQMLYLDLKLFMVSLNLTYNDKMTMAASVEGRVPFLDWELAEWVAHHIPPSLKLRGNTTKHILREAMRPLLPAEVLTQKKAGFGAPVDYWLANDMRTMTDDLLSEHTLRRRGILDPKVVHRYVSEHRSGQQDWSLQLWQFITLELWMQAFIDQPLTINGKSIG